jgi:hypothetical protein
MQNWYSNCYSYIMLASLINTANSLDWVIGGIIAANVILFGVLTFFPGIHNRITRLIFNLFNKL